jgi:hypothetical protein
MLRLDDGQDTACQSCMGQTLVPERGRSGTPKLVRSLQTRTLKGNMMPDGFEAATVHLEDTLSFVRLAG